MRSINTKIQLIALALVLALSAVAFGQDSSASTQPQSSSSASEVRKIANEQKVKIEGIVTNRNADTFTLRGLDGKETEVVLTDKTSIKIGRKGWFRTDQKTNASSILRGLRLKVEGKGNSDGQLVAKEIRFDEQDLKTAQALESRVDPVEAQANSTQALAESNATRIEAAEQNAQRLSGQVDELSSVANEGLAAAKNAQGAADQAQSTADTAIQRIDNLDDYEVLRTITVYFKPGSARLSSAAKTEIDDAASSVNENLKGWVVAVVGYADSRGKTARNRSLSERRANAVIDYLVTKHGLPMRRVVQPFGYGSLDPVAANDTRDGRALNRRAEIRVLVNKGISQASL
jgi:outer membrane protein OmpA-like peptidoglycan-associated protein